MLTIESIQSLKNFSSTKHENDWVYVNMANWESNPKKCTFYFITEQEVEDMPDEQVYESAAGPFLPKTLENIDLYPWMETKILNGIFNTLNKQHHIITDDLFIKAINHYREFDDFME